MRTTILLFAAATLAGCATIPKQLSQAAVAPKEINQAVRCEIAYALASNIGDISFFTLWVAAVQLETTLIDTAKFEPGLTLKGKIADAEVSVPSSLSYSDVRKGKAILKYDDLELDDTVNDSCPARGGPGAATGLGLADWLELVGSTLTKTTSGGGTISELEYEVAFSVERGVTGGLTFKTDHVEVGLNQNTLSRKNENKLIIAFGKPAPKQTSSDKVRELQRGIDLQRERREQRTIIQLEDQTIIVE